MNLERVLLDGGPFDGLHVQTSIAADRLFKETIDDRYSVYDRSDQKRDGFAVFRFKRYDSIPSRKVKVE